jgi:hypothetical protein
MKTKFYKITFILLVIMMGNTAFAQYNLLYVGKGDAGVTEPSDPVDVKLTEFLFSQGYTTNFVGENDYKAAPYDDAATYEAYDAIFISEVVGSGSVVNYKTAGFPIPCVSTEGYCVRTDKWALITDNDAQFLQLSSADVTADVLTLVIEDVDHWIASNYDTPYDLVWSSVDVTENNQIGVTGYKLDENVDGAVELGSFLIEGMAGFPSLWAIPEGSTLISDGDVTLPNIVIIGVIGPGLGDYATQEFNELVVNSLKWVTGDYEVPESIINASYNNLNVWPNPTNSIVNVSFDLAVSGNVRINIYNITGSLVETITSDYLTAGNNSLQIDLTNMADGQYFYEILTSDEILKGKIYKN